MNKKQTIRLNESQLRRIVKESVFRIMGLNESSGDLVEENPELAGKIKKIWGFLTN